MKKGMRKSILNAVFMAVILVLTLLAVFKGEDLGKIGQCLLMADDRWIVLAVVCVLLFILGESVVILYLLRTLRAKVRFSHCCLYSFIGFFYSCITPSASGGQPMQVIAMRKDNISGAVSTVVLAIVTITYKLVLVVIGLAVMILQPKDVILHLQGVEGLVYLGLALNVGCIILLLMLVFSPSLVKKCAVTVMRWIGSIRPFKHPDRIEERMEKWLHQYNGTAEYFGTHKVVIFNVFVITLLQRLFLFLVTWFTYQAFGLSGDSLFTVVTLQAMISVVVDMLPVPGGMGVSENLFMQIFLPIFGSTLVLPGLVISRGISYYTQLALSGVMTLVASFVLRTTNEKENAG